MANHVNHRRKILRDPRFRASDSYYKGVNQSRKYEKQEWNQHVRRDGHAFTRDFYRRNHILFSGYPERDEVLEEVVVTKRPWVD